MTLGANFSFKGNNITSTTSQAILPGPPSTSPYTGKWVYVEDDTKVYTAAELRDNYNGSTMAGTWVWETVSYKITFAAPEEAMGSMANLKAAPGEDVTVTNTFRWFNHTFTGFTDQDGNFYESTDGKTVTIPANTYAANAEVTLTAQFEENENKVTVEDGMFTLTLHGGETATFADLPAGTAYQIFEDTPDGWVLVSQENVSGVIQPCETAAAAFTNRFSPGVTTAQLYGTKTLDNRLAGAGDFSFQLWEVVEEDGREVEKSLSTVTTMDGGLFQFPVIEYSTADDAAVGTHTYRIREVAGSDSTIQYDSHTETVTVEVTQDEDGALHATVNYDTDGAAFVNVTRPGILKVTKETEGIQTDANKDQQFELEITLANQNGMPLGDGDAIYWYVEGEDYGSNPTPARTSAAMSSPTTTGTLQGTAYAVLTDDGELIFFRSSGTYTNKATGTFTDIDGNSYNGTVFTGFETASYTSRSAVPWYSNRTNIKSVRFAQTIAPKSTANWFYECENLRNVDLSKLDTSKVTSMDAMFYYCSSLTSLDVSGFDTSKVTDMSCMFSNCSSLPSLDVSSFDTSNVTHMNAMFRSCSSLTSLDVSSFNTSKVTNMDNMFEGCSSLTSLDVTGFDTSNVENMSFMFYNCSSLPSLDVSGFDTSKVTDMYCMFYDCSSLSSVNLGANFSFKGKNITNSTNQAILPVPPSTSPYTGKWTLLEDESNAFTAAQLRDNYDGATMSGTWVWQAANDTCIVRFDANGGYTSASNIVLKASETSSVTMPDDTTTRRPGWLLTGWTTNADGTGTTYFPGGTYTFSSLTGGSYLNLYAKWLYTGMYRYTVQYYQQDAQDESKYTLTESEYELGLIDTTVTPAVDEQKYENFHYDHSDPASAVIVKDESAVVRHYFNHDRYTIVFDGNGAEGGSVNGLNMVVGLSNYLPANSFYYYAHIFTGWNTKPDGTGTAYSDKQSVIDLGGDGDTITLYAQWVGNNNSVEPTGGVFTVTIQGGQTIVIPDLPAGTTYHITEKDVPDGWTMTGTVNADGTITANTAAEATVTNTYQAETAVALTAHKELIGDAISEGQFAFQLMDNNGRVISTQSPADCGRQRRRGHEPLVRHRPGELRSHYLHGGGDLHLYHP